ncbi:class I SAM-dependent methyltransferase [Ectobacillus ponti]|uniref:Class I SAM-dependent methyltransferase n=1 Tax=Ectobacillus ponti TaxID=2961894 RepID=A0AA41X6Y1_9BACI|nr:class I SAM-dependent methyltransferase [Ectobacillus ponti]MCP8967455.1 class I SAM-dependent methyltransferase [Ectobacillus ponti]
MSKVEELFSILDTTALILRKDMDLTYLEALVETGSNIFEQDIQQKHLMSSAQERLKREYRKLENKQYKSEDMRKAFQLCLLKGMKNGVQANHEMTPDAVGMFVSYLFNRFFAGQSGLRVLDPAVGTGNLLTTLFNHREDGTAMSGYAVEADELLLRLAFMNADLQQHEIECFHGDALAPLYIDPVDAVVCDLPVGYYPNEERAQEYRLRAEKGMSYAHHLFIEQSIRHTKEGGYLLFLVPNFLFESDQADQLRSFLRDTCHIQGLLQLPVSLFKNEQNAKSIFVLQKKGPQTKAPKQALLAELPKFSNAQAMQSMMLQIQEWFKVNK